MRLRDSQHDHDTMLFNGTPDTAAFRLSRHKSGAVDR
jgi:hypothetical protein